MQPPVRGGGGFGPSDGPSTKRGWSLERNYIPPMFSVGAVASDDTSVCNSAQRWKMSRNRKKRISFSSAVTHSSFTTSTVPEERHTRPIVSWTWYATQKWPPSVSPAPACGHDCIVELFVYQKFRMSSSYNNIL